MSTVIKRRIEFYECEHRGDSSHYEEALITSGAKVLYTKLDLDEERCRITIEVQNWEKFLEKFKTTDSYGFSSES